MIRSHRFQLSKLPDSSSANSQFSGGTLVFLGSLWPVAVHNKIIYNYVSKLLMFQIGKVYLQFNQILYIIYEAIIYKRSTIDQYD